MKRIVGIVVIVGVAAIIGFAMRNNSTGPGGGAGNAAIPVSAGSRAARGSLGSDAVLAIAPGRAVQSSSAPARPMSASLQEFYSAKGFAKLYARLKAATARTPEEQWMLAEIATRCGKIDGVAERPSAWKLGSPGARERFVASLAPDDPDRERRIGAFDAINFDDCAGLGDITLSRADIRALLEAGAAGGDPKARAAVVLEQLEDSIRGPDGKQGTGLDSIPRITDAQLETLRQVIASGDPLAIRAAATPLTLEYQNMSLRDAEDRPIDRLAFIRAAILLTCDYGLACGADAQWIAHACAGNGQCSANSLRDHMMYYNSSPSSSQVMAGYEAALRNAARDGNWSFFHFFPGPNPQTAAFQSRNGP